MGLTALFLSSILAGVFAGYVAPPTPWDDFLDEVIHENFPKEVEKLKLDPVVLPDVEFTVGNSRVSLTGGKAEGLGKVVRRRGRCNAEDDDLVCHLTFDGMRITYDAVATDPDKKLSVEVYTQQGLVEVTINKRAPRPALKEARILSVFKFVRRAEFSEEPEKTIAFDNQLKLKLHSLFVESPTLREVFSRAFVGALSEAQFPEV